MSEIFPFTFTKNFHHKVYPAIDPANSALSAKGKVVLVTGGGRGLGKEIAKSFARAHADAIVLLGRNVASLESAAKEISAIGADTKVRVFGNIDVRDGNAVATAVKSAKAEVGPIDVFINNAGDFFYGSIADSDPSDYWSSVEINGLGSLNCAQTFLKHGIDESPKQTPTFINLSTVGAHAPPYPNMSSYAVGKAGALMMMQYLQAEMGDKLRVFSIHPGTIKTDMADKAGIPTADEAGKSNIPGVLQYRELQEYLMLIGKP